MLLTVPNQVGVDYNAHMIEAIQLIFFMAILCGSNDTYSLRADVERLLNTGLAIASATQNYRRQAGGLGPAPDRLDQPQQELTGSMLMLPSYNADGLCRSKNHLDVYPSFDCHAFTCTALALAVMQRTAS